MEKLEFPWLRDIPVPVIKAEAVPSKFQRLEVLRPHTSKILLVVAVLGLALVGRLAQPRAPLPKRSSNAATDLMVMSLVAIPKGHRIPIEALTEVRLRANTLTKTQRLRALLPEQLPRLRYDIVAKKDIAPQTPLFWSDLALKSVSAHKASHPKPSRIYFDESRTTP